MKIQKLNRAGNLENMKISEKQGINPGFCKQPGLMPLFVPFQLQGISPGCWQKPG